MHRNEEHFVKRLHVAAFEQLVRDTTKAVTAREVTQREWDAAKRVAVAATERAYALLPALDSGEVH